MGSFWLLTLTGTFASSSVARMRSLPARGTWVSFRRLRPVRQHVHASNAYLLSEDHLQIRASAHWLADLQSTGTHHKLAFPGHVTLAHASEGVVALTLAQGCRMDVSGEETDRCQHTTVECGL